MSEKCYTYTISKTNRKGNKMTIATTLYKVGDTYTTQKSKVTGTILAIDPQANGNVRSQ